jgi:hypothetical protein
MIKKLQNMEYFNCLDSTIRNGASEIKCKEQISKVLHLERSLYGAENWTLWKVNQKYLGSFEM